MNALSLLLLLAPLLASAKNVPNMAPLRTTTDQMGFCQKTDWADKLLFTLIPDPLPLMPLTDVQFQFQMDLLKTVPVGTQLKVKLVKEAASNITIPCTKIPGSDLPIGSCDYDLGTLLDQVDCSEGTGSFDVPPGQNCQLPLRPGHYGMEYPKDVNLPDHLPETLVNLLVGQFDLQGTFVSKEGKEMMCLQLKLRFSAP